jgi:hypothetical protein
MSQSYTASSLDTQVCLECQDVISGETMKHTIKGPGSAPDNDLLSIEIVEAGEIFARNGVLTYATETMQYNLDC